jgi:quercetin dioxygenase-like cupin family protein
MSSQTLLAADAPGVFQLDGASQATPSSIISRTLLQTPELRVALFAFAEGQELTPHSSRRRVTIQILDGECDFLFADVWHHLGKGSFVHLPPGELHAVRAASGPFSMLLTFGPEPAN